MARMMKIVIVLCSLLLLAILSGSVFAQGATPQQTAEAIRQDLFAAQSALLTGDVETAVNAVETAQAEYEQRLRPELSAAAPELVARLDGIFATALTTAQAGDSLQLAVLRGEIWTGFLQGGTAVVLNALTNNEADTAAQWLSLREFRPSTKFSRPNADATLAIQKLKTGEITAEAAFQAVQNDLLDTYQSQLNIALAGADEAGERGFTMRRAEQAGLAAGYFNLLGAAFADQRGAEALTASQQTFTELVTAASAADDALFAAARTNVDTVLVGFRAAPLSDVEAARRAGQMVRFIALVPVEYERGVRNGAVVNDLEIQEAYTFLDGATAAFTDLQTALAQRDAVVTAEIVTLLATVKQQIGATADPADLAATVTTINTRLTTLLPEEWQQVNNDSDVDVILSVLEQVETAVKQNQYPQAESARLEAYALLELGIEQRLRGFAPEKAINIESLFWQGNGEQQGLAVLLGTNAPFTEVKATIVSLRAALIDARDFLGAAKSAPEAVVGNAAVIVFREGLEAVLILASLLASLRTVEDRRFRRPIVIGAGLALLASAITWWLANQLLLSLMQYGEKLEAIVSLIAIGVLLVITNWFFHKVYWTGWMAGFHARKRQLVGGMVVIAISQSMGLVILGFTSIYREGFETVLFLQSLVLEAGTSIVMQGVVLGLVGVAIVGAITFALQVRLPYKKMLIVTGVMIGFVLLTMVGHTVHVMQAVGWLPITPISNLHIPFWMGQWFGLFATWQGIILQFVAGAFVIGSYFLAEHQTRGRRTQPEKKTAGQTA